MTLKPKIIMLIGKPTHYRPNNHRVSACGVPLIESNGSYDARDADCLRCIKTKAYKIYMQLGR